MTDVYLFDWGDTLMVDFPGVPGKMCDWKYVEAVKGAEDALKSISGKAQIYVATGAADSTEYDIKKAFHRVGLDKYITGYFCQSNLGVEKGSSAFLLKILDTLERSPSQVTMIGDNFDKDINPAQQLGMNTIWLSKEQNSNLSGETKVIDTLGKLAFPSTQQP